MATGKATGGAIDHSDTLISHRAKSTFVPLVRCTKMPLPSWEAQSHKGEGYTLVAYPCRAWQRTGKNHFESICGSRTGEECLRSLLSKFECICWQGRAYNSGAIHVHHHGDREWRSVLREERSIHTRFNHGFFVIRDGTRAVRLNLTLSHHPIRLLGSEQPLHARSSRLSHPPWCSCAHRGALRFLQRATLDSASEARRM